jgi:hypothetical protein
MRYALILIMLLLCGLPLKAQDTSDQTMKLAEGVYAYERRDFATAITLWEDVLETASLQPHLYYNLARAYEYLGDWGQARMYDLRTRAYYDIFAFFNTTSPDLQSALDRGWARQEIDALHPLIWLKRELHGVMRPTGWGLLGFTLWTAFWGMVIIYSRRHVGRWMLVGLASGVLLWGSVVAIRTALDSRLPEAVSLEMLPVYSGPGSDYVTLTTWTPGYDLYILQTRDDWAQVMRSDGVIGWVERRLIWQVPQTAKDMGVSLPGS